MSRAPSAAPLEVARPSVVAQGQTVYVPVYSHIYTGHAREKALEVTLSVRNVDLDQPIFVESIDYYDNEGQLLRSYLDDPVVLGPLASADFLVERRDLSGGVGANFLVRWASEEPVTQPLIESVMVNSDDSRAFAFARPGVVVSSRGE